MSLHKEINFEEDICRHLADNGWFHADGDATNYDRARALFPEDLLTWIKTTQPKAWEAIVKNYGAHAEATLLDRLREQLDARGTLDVLRHGIEFLGLREKLLLAQFRPALGMNADLVARYDANRLRIVRQVRYSLKNENCLDLVLLLNGIPVATAELKTDFTQSVDDAVDQYRFDRVPRSKGGAVEPLLSFPSGALVHFAVSNSEVAMVTKLDGAATRFLPFNRGNGGAAGNPPNANGHRTAYLWEEVWQRDSWLEILGKYLVAPRDKKKQITKVIFPRYHQLDATRKLRAAVLKDGPGQTYLIQHSAGSGKTNSIAWSAHFLTDVGGGEVREKEKALLNAIIEKVNELFEGDLSDEDKLVYVNNVLKGKLLESQRLMQQASSNTKEQFANSPDLANEILNAVMGALDAHTTMSTQALNSQMVRNGLKDVLLNEGQLYESLRQRATDAPAGG